MKRILAFVAIVIAALAAAAIYGLRAARAPSASPAPTHEHAAAAAGTPRGDVTIDPRRQQLIGVRTVTATRMSLSPTIRAVGAVRYAETRLSDVNLKVDGWIRDLFVDYTGQPIAKGQPLFTLYSPDLLATENEYLLALKTRDQLQSSQIADVRMRADQIVASARQRLVLWDVPDEELRMLDEQRQPRDRVTFRSPVSGVVIEKAALPGMHVTAGQTLYKVADLTTVWVEADVYETELPLVRLGAPATVTIDAYPGERFTGRVVYIYPYVNETTRTNRVRYEFANRGGRLKPGMFANVDISAPSRVAVTVPMDAVLDSGTEQVVFIAKGDGYFEPRRVTIGRRLGDRIQIVDGVKDGEQVATGATFFLDSESQLRGSLEGYQGPPGTPAGPATAPQIDIVLHTSPDPPTTGGVQLEAVVRDVRGTPVENADVVVQFFMPAMPTMNMPAMQSETRLTPAGNGVYRGSGQVLMAGRWEVTVVVTRGGQRLGSRQFPMVTK